MEGEEIFGFYKQKANLAPRSKGDSHKHNCVNFFHPCVNHIITKSNVDNEQHTTNQIWENVEVLEALCGDGVWHIKICPHVSHVQCSMLQKSTKHSRVRRIITELTFIGVPIPTYSRLCWLNWPHKIKSPFYEWFFWKTCD